MLSEGLAEHKLYFKNSQRQPGEWVPCDLRSEADALIKAIHSLKNTCPGNAGLAFAFKCHLQIFLSEKSQWA